MLTATEKLSEYILRPRDERIAHADLDTPCDCGSRKGKQDNRRILRLLYDILNIENDVENRQAAAIDVCHLCEEKNCHNPLHCYIGTRQENHWDVPEEVRKRAATVASEAARLKLARRAPRGKNRGLTLSRGDEVYFFESTAMAARALGLSTRRIYDVLTGRNRTTRGFVASYAD